MTEMPELVSILRLFVGLAAVLVVFHLSLHHSPWLKEQSLHPQRGDLSMQRWGCNLLVRWSYEQSYVEDLWILNPGKPCCYPVDISSIWACLWESLPLRFQWFLHDFSEVIWGMSALIGCL